MAKGSQFERDTCRQLSEWWSGGTRSDIYWRTSQSGGRATQRAKSGKKTFGSYGDITAVDPIGAPLLQMFTIELKRGRSHGDPGDLLDFKEENKSHPFCKTICQAMKSAEHAGSVSWLIISRRDHRQAVVFLESKYADRLHRICGGLFGFCAVQYRFRVDSEFVQFVGLRFDHFLAHIHPKHVKNLLKNSL